MIEQYWTAADNTPIPENKFYEGLPVWSFTEDLTNKKVTLKPSQLEFDSLLGLKGTVRAIRIYTTDEGVVDLYDDQEIVTLQPSGFQYKSAGLLDRFDAVVSLFGDRWHKGQNLFMNADVHTISRVEPLGPRQPCYYRPVAKTFVARGFLGRFKK